MNDSELAERRLEMIQLLLAIVKDMQPETVRQKLKSMASADEVSALIQSCNLEAVDIEILTRIYIKKQSPSAAADFLGYSERGFRERHRKALKIVGKNI